jgi:hypothetical protein
MIEQKKPAQKPSTAKCQFGTNQTLPKISWTHTKADIHWISAAPCWKLLLLISSWVFILLIMTWLNSVWADKVRNIFRKKTFLELDKLENNILVYEKVLDLRSNFQRLIPCQTNPRFVVNLRLLKNKPPPIKLWIKLWATQILHPIHSASTKLTTEGILILNGDFTYYCAHHCIH